MLTAQVGKNVSAPYPNITGITPQKLNLRDATWPNDEYSFHSVKTLQLFHLNGFKRLKDCTMAYLCTADEVVPSFWERRREKDENLRERHAR